MTNRKWVWILFASVIFCFSGILDAAKGHWELGVHAGSWSLNLVRSLIEDKVGEVIEDNLKEKFLDEIREDYPDAQITNYNQSLRFDSSGSNLGFEARWYPAGEGGSFSIGMSVEKSAMKVAFPSVTVDMNVYSAYKGKSGYFTAEVNSAQLEIKPLSYHLGVRWDIVPSGRIHPYITFGAGIFSVTYLEKGKLHAEFAGDLIVPGEESRHYDDSIDKTVKEAIEESEENDDEKTVLPSILPIVQLNIGIKGELTRQIHLLLDFGIWDGFLFRGGVGFRF